MITRTEPKYCTTCKKLQDAHKSLDTDAVPRPGDLSICLYCATLSKFDEDLNLIPLTPQELEDIKSTDAGAYQVMMKAAIHITQLIKKTNHE
jgi:hypothetical protein